MSEEMVRCVDPYIGITDFTSFEQVQRMLSVFKANKRSIADRRWPIHSDMVPWNRRLHVGVMMSYKTLHGLPTKWAASFPPKEKIAEIFGSTETFNCLHYADYENRPDFADSLALAMSFCGPNLHAIQLDMVWPDFTQLGKGYYSGCRSLGLNPLKVDVILQINSVAMAACVSTSKFNTDLDILINRMRHYEDRVHRVLIDKSMGKGIGMNAEELRPLVGGFAEDCRFIIGVAGGLGPHTMHLVEPLVPHFPYISIDAQGQLRSSGNALDPIEWDRAEQYLIKALELLD